MDMKEIQSIDFIVGAGYHWGEEAYKKPFEFYEFQVMAKKTFAGVAKKMGLKPREEWKRLPM